MEYLDLNCLSQRGEAMLAFFAVGSAGLAFASMMALAIAPLFRKA